MSAFESPVTSSTRPTSVPSAASTRQPGSIDSQDAGSAIRPSPPTAARPGPASRPAACRRAPAGRRRGRGCLRGRSARGSGGPSPATRRSRTATRRGSGAPNGSRRGAGSWGRRAATFARRSRTTRARSRRRGRSSRAAAARARRPTSARATPARSARARRASPRRRGTAFRRRAARRGGAGGAGSHRGSARCRRARPRTAAWSGRPGTAAPGPAAKPPRRRPRGCAARASAPPFASPPAGRIQAGATCRRARRKPYTGGAVAKVERKRAVSEDLLRDFLREMLLIRRFEERVEERFRAGELPGFLHVAIGQEAVAVGVCQAMEDGDVFASTHRAHGHTLARGTHPNAVMAELYGKIEGCSHGYGGSMHLYDVERGNLGANAVIGGGLPAVVGAGLAFKLRDEPRVAVAFFGDGATNIGTFHEALNLAQLWKVPAVFVLEDNHWAESTPESQHSPIRDLSERAKAFGMKAVKADGQDVEAVYKTAHKALEHARSGEGPVFLHLDTVRFSGHYIGDPQVYRDKDEARELRATRDPIELLRARIEMSDEDFAELDSEVTEMVEASVEF